MTAADAAPPLQGWARYAVYYTPAPDSALAQKGDAWLEARPEAETVAPSGGRAALTAQPRRYGFHATLKPPFALADGTDADGLDAAVAALAADLAPAQAGGLAVKALGGFLALCPTGDVTGINAVAAACVTRLDAFRAPPSAAETARRAAAGLTERQAALQAQYGYPYVLDMFRFHLTLTGPVAGPEAKPLRHALAAWLASALPKPFTLDALTLCGDPGDGGRFVALRRYPLTGAA